jgi:glycosyltransferase involved in cell wall biosynthesis
VQRLRNDLPCADRIHLRDHAPWPGALLAAADGFVLDSFFEGWSLASMEALAAGLPVVLSDVGGAREQIGEGERGYLVGNPVGDPLAVDWNSIRAALFAAQPNRDELVGAMSAMVQARDDWRSRREALRAESAVRFHPDRALSGHASVLRDAAAVGAALPRR